MNTKLRRSVVALAAALASLAFLATPTAAGVHDADVTASFTMWNGTAYFTSYINDDGTWCPASMQVTADHTAWTANVTSFTSTIQFIFGGAHWIAVITRLSSTSGTAGNGSIGGFDPTLTVRMDIYEQNGNDSTYSGCANQGTRRCTLRVSNIGLSGTYTGGWTTTSTSMSSSSYYLLQGSGTVGNIVGQTCSTPFNVFVGGTAGINSADLFTTGTT